MNPAERDRLLADVDAFCEEVRPVEELCYVEHRFNDQVIPLARKYNLLAIPVVDDEERLQGIITFDDALDTVLPDNVKRRARAVG